MTLPKRTAAWAAVVTSALTLGACASTPSVDTLGPSSSTASVGTTSSAVDTRAFERLEAEFDARVGVYAVDTATGRTVQWRADERFAYASTYKALAAGAILAATSPGELAEKVTYTREELVTYSPVTEKYAGKGMSLGDLAEAAVRRSDNTAGNLLLKALGGPAGFEQALRGLGDDTTEAARLETQLNAAMPGNVQDTSTPSALALDLQAYVIGDALSDDDRALLRSWLSGNATGDTLIRAGVPASWTVADKSGAGEYGTRNDIAVIWPESGGPLVLAILTSRDGANDRYDDKLVARTADAALQALT